MKVLVLSDGRAGHFRQSKGVLKVLGQLTPIEPAWIDVRLRLGVFRDIQRWWLNFGCPLPSSATLCRINGIEQLPDWQPQLIVSTGGKTSFANAALARQFGCDNIFCGSLRGLNEDLFTRIVTIDDAHAADARYIVSGLPTEIDPAVVTADGDRYRTSQHLEPARRWTLLIGGDSGDYRFSDHEWQALIDGVRVLANQHGIRWLITTSRRTGPEIEQKLKPLRELDAVDDLVLYSSDDRKVVSAFLGCAERVFCTDDSAMMISEAVAAGRPVVSLVPACARPARGNRMLLSLYSRQRRLRRISLPDWVEQAADTSAEIFADGIESAPLDELRKQLKTFLRAA